MKGAVDIYGFRTTANIISILIVWAVNDWVVHLINAMELTLNGGVNGSISG